ncbi:MAG: hypothetical protein AVDCRST_MAG11-3873, partial [uncultured Gemmatimonadaceae bacterium]
MRDGRLRRNWRAFAVLGALLGTAVASAGG